MASRPAVGEMPAHGDGKSNGNRKHSTGQGVTADFVRKGTRPEEDAPAAE